MKLKSFLQLLESVHKLTPLNVTQQHGEREPQKFSQYSLVDISSLATNTSTWKFVYGNQGVFTPLSTEYKQIMNKKL